MISTIFTRRSETIEDVFTSSTVCMSPLWSGFFGWKESWKPTRQWTQLAARKSTLHQRTTLKSRINLFYAVGVVCTHTLSPLMSYYYMRNPFSRRTILNFHCQIATFRLCSSAIFSDLIALSVFYGNICCEIRRGMFTLLGSFNIYICRWKSYIKHLT